MIMCGNSRRCVMQEEIPGVLKEAHEGLKIPGVVQDIWRVIRVNFLLSNKWMKGKWNLGTLLRQIYKEMTLLVWIKEKQKPRMFYMLKGWSKTSQVWIKCVTKGTLSHFIFWRMWCEIKKDGKLIADAYRTANNLYIINEIKSNKWNQMGKMLYSWHLIVYYIFNQSILHCWSNLFLPFSPLVEDILI